MTDNTPQAEIKFSDGRTFTCDELTGTEGEKALDISSLRRDTGFITLDDGYRNTGSTKSKVCYINGEEGQLRYRGYPIKKLAERLDFVSTALLLLTGELPDEALIERFRDLLTRHQRIDERLMRTLQNHPPGGDPMAELSAGVNLLSCTNAEVLVDDGDDVFLETAARMMAKIRTIAAASYKVTVGEPIMYPDPSLCYEGNFLHMMFSRPREDYIAEKVVTRALSLFLLLHAEHEQNCSTSTVRMVGSSGANLFASCAAGICALWGPLHGGANVKAILELMRIEREGMSVEEYVELIKSGSDRLMGFGHGVYKSYDPRAEILKREAHLVLESLDIQDPLFEIAMELEQVALSDPYFTSRNLYPNVDFYSGIILRAIGIPVNMFTVLFAIGRLPGWMTHWKEVRDKVKGQIARPRQVYDGEPERDL